MTQNVDTAEAQVNMPSETTVNNEQGTAGVEPTVADLHNGKEEVKTQKSNEVTSVPFKKFIKEKEKRKELERELAELRSKIEGELEESDSDDDVDDEPQVKKLAQKLEQIEERELLAKKDAIFTEHFNRAIQNSPEYKNIANVEVIKALAFNPANANKTYKQLLEEAYGNAVTGRRTIETTTPRGGAKDTKVDMKRATTDTAYRHEVLSDPELRRQYNESLTDRIFR